MSPSDERLPADYREGVAMSTEERLTNAFVELADTLVDEFDVIDFLGVLTRHCMDLLGSAAVGIMLADHHGELHVAASTSEQARMVELFELQVNEGPCLDCYQTSQPVVNAHLPSATDRWPHFVPQAMAAGFQSVHALPLRLRDEVIGAMNLFGENADPLAEDAIRLGQAMADVATIGILHERAVRRAEVLAEQLQSALSSRIVIEQAKGVLAERGGMEMEDAFLALRAYARRNRLRLAELARQVIEGNLDTGPLLRSAGSPRHSSGRR